jgi:hypothetical protein
VGYVVINHIVVFPFSNCIIDVDEMIDLLIFAAIAVAVVAAIAVALLQGNAISGNRRYI